MKISVLGTGAVGRAWAGRTSGLGHQVAVGTRDPKQTLARTEPDRQGTPPYSAFHLEHPEVPLVTFAEATARADVIVNATTGNVSLDVLELASAGDLRGKLLIDIANPLDFSQGFPPSLFVCNTESLAERIQTAHPETKVVKTLNTLGAAVMVEPAKLGSADHTVFVSGDDEQAKATVTELLESFGWVDIIDLGGLSSARATEMLMPIWLRLMGKVGGPMFNFKIVR